MITLLLVRAVCHAAQFSGLSPTNRQFKLKFLIKTPPTHNHIPAIRNQVPDLSDPKLLDLSGECEVIAQIRHLVLEQEIQPFVELVIFTLSRININPD